MALLLAAAIYAIQFLTPLLYPFLISLLVALAINRPVTYLCKRARLPRWLSVLLMMVLLLALIGGALTLIIAKTAVELGELITRLPHFISELTNYLSRTISQDVVTGLYNRLLFFYTQLDKSYQTTIDTNVTNALRSVTEAGQTFVLTLLNELYTLIATLPSLATVLIISLLGAFFISKDFYRWEARFRRVLPRGVNRRLDQIVVDLRNALFGFVKAQLTLISLTAAIVMIGLLILRVEYAVTIGLLTGLVDLMPYLGTGTVFVPWIVYAFFKGQYGLVIGLSVLYAVVVIFRQIVEPKLVADNVGLDPLLTLIALFVGLKLFGFLGLIVGPVSLVVINALIKADVFRDIWTYIVGKPTQQP